MANKHPHLALVQQLILEICSPRVPNRNGINFHRDCISFFIGVLILINLILCTFSGLKLPWAGLEKNRKQDTVRTDLDHHPPFLTAEVCSQIEMLCKHLEWKSKQTLGSKAKPVPKNYC